MRGAKGERERKKKGKGTKCRMRRRKERKEREKGTRMLEEKRERGDCYRKEKEQK